eukprot:TRINITY_DN6321_c0_g1_i1.p1 TRINITY_DN6321_c0_g1~~TRINITY_DN6321_c0_g1_i1.p1  ORF type:complete len:286 (-),score=78.01 TRINITY_DN6321_c0_g1_i1:115-915(-)
MEDDDDELQRLQQTLVCQKETWTALECKYLRPECLTRYLIGSGNNFDLAVQMILDTLKWREEQQVDFNSITQHKSHFSTGKIYPFGKDKDGNSIIYMKLRLDPPDDVEGKVPFFTWNFEYLLNKTDGRISWIVDCAGFPYYYLYAGHLNMAYTVANMLANNYPERLGTLFFVNIPWLFRSFWAISSQWVKPVTKDKVCLVSSYDVLLDKIDASELEMEYGGTNDFQFDAEELYQKFMEEENVWLEENKRLAQIIVQNPSWPVEELV